MKTKKLAKALKQYRSFPRKQLQMEISKFHAETIHTDSQIKYNICGPKSCELEDGRFKFRPWQQPCLSPMIEVFAFKGTEPVFNISMMEAKWLHKFLGEVLDKHGLE